MKLSRKNLKLFLVLIIALTLGCGGGSTGTGGSGPDDFQVKGKISGPDGAPLPGTRITLLETGDSATSDESGSYALQTEFPGENASLLLERGNASAAAQLSGLQADTVATVDLELNETANEVRVISISITPLEDGEELLPTPEPSPRPVENGGNSNGQPTPTPEPTPEPEDRLSLFTGSLHRSRDDSPLQGAKITIAEASDVTDSSGEFNIKSAAYGDVSVRIKYGSEVFATLLHKIPHRPVHVIIELQINPSELPNGEPHPVVKEVGATVVSITPRKGK